MKPMLKAPVTKRLKLTHDEPPSVFAFKFNLHHYSMAERAAELRGKQELAQERPAAGAFTRPLFSST